MPASAPYLSLLQSLSLDEALWWFIENVSEDDPDRTQYFFALRERVRTTPATDMAELTSGPTDVRELAAQVAVLASALAVKVFLSTCEERTAIKDVSGLELFLGPAANAESRVLYFAAVIAGEALDVANIHPLDGIADVRDLQLGEPDLQSIAEYLRSATANPQCRVMDAAEWAAISEALASVA